MVMIHEGKHEKRKIVRECMHRENPNCYWCGIETVLHPIVFNGLLPDDAATVDHLKSRFERKPNEVVAKVLACYKCNTRRSHEETKQMLKKNPKAVFNPGLR